MGRVTSLFAHKVARQTHPSLDRRVLLATLGIDADAPVDPSFMVTDTDYYAFLETIARTDPEAIDLPLRTGDSMRCDDYGAFGLAWKAAPNLRGSFERAERYALVLTSVALYSVESAAEGTYMQLNRAGARRLGMRLSNEATIASILSISRQVATQPLQPLAIFFKHAAPVTVDAHERHFGCPVHFGADRDALLWNPRDLDIPNRLGDESIVAFLDAHLDTTLGDYEDSPTLASQAQREITRALSAGIPRISSIAGTLGMSGRTLQRRLADDGLTFQQLVDATRHQLAEQLLADSAYPLAEIAFLTGFSEQSAFTRAFRRWAGATPATFRQQNAQR